ncbi:helix-turn-helix domain-containing protein [Candidatus Bipolaricaulota bacterium]|nr:helix-turn-helix domain-containing protein [Candidatus Bipolaricaulota bacterium]
MAHHSRLLSTTEAAKYLAVHANTVRRWETQGLLQAYRLGTRGDRRFTRNELERFLKSSTNGGSQ